jgi:hypothetical protein
MRPVGGSGGGCRHHSGGSPWRSGPGRVPRLTAPGAPALGATRHWHRAWVGNPPGHAGRTKRSRSSSVSAPLAISTGRPGRTARISSTMSRPRAPGMLMSSNTASQGAFARIHLRHDGGGRGGLCGAEAHVLQHRHGYHPDDGFVFDHQNRRLRITGGGEIYHRCCILGRERTTLHMVARAIAGVVDPRFSRGSEYRRDETLNSVFGCIGWDSGRRLPPGSWTADAIGGMEGVCLPLEIRPA